MSIYNNDWQEQPELKTTYEISSLSIPSFSICPEFFRLSDIFKTRKDFELFVRFCYMYYIFILYYVMILTVCFLSVITNLETIILCLVQMAISFFSLHLYLVPVYAHLFNLEITLCKNEQKRKVTTRYIDNMIFIKNWRDIFDTGFMIHLVSSFIYFIYTVVSFFIISPSIVFFLLSFLSLGFIFFYMIYLHIQISLLNKEEEKRKLGDILLKTSAERDLKFPVKCFLSIHLLQVIIGVILMGFS